MYMLDSRNVCCPWVYRLFRKTALQGVTFLVENNLMHMPTLIYLAIDCGNIEILQYLYEKGGRSRYAYMNLCIQAAQTGNLAILQLYLTEEDVQLDLDKLHEVWNKIGKKEGILQILEWVYSNSQVTDSMTERVLGEAAGKGHTEAVQYLLHNHVRMITENSVCFANAVLQGHLDIFDILCNHLDKKAK